MNEFSSAPGPTENARPYHHGSLRAALLTATVDFIRQHGLENLSIREIAKQLGVSPAAPFRHFASRSALLTAVAEEAILLLRKSYEAQIAASDSDNPLAHFMALGHGYLIWATSHPTHFLVLNSRNLIDVGGSELLKQENAHLQNLMAELLHQAEAQGLLPPEARPRDLILGGRALVYGLARMVTDGHMRGVPEETLLPMLEAAMRAYVSRVQRSD